MEITGTDFQFEVCPYCGQDIVEAFFDETEVSPGSYNVKCPYCGHMFGMLFTYSVMTYKLPDGISACV